MERIDVADRPMEVARSQVRYGSNEQLYRSPEVFRRAVLDDLTNFYDHIDHAALERASQALADARNVLIASTRRDYCTSALLRYSGFSWFSNWRLTGAYDVGREAFIEDISDGGVLVARRNASIRLRGLVHRHGGQRLRSAGGRYYRHPRIAADYRHSRFAGRASSSPGRFHILRVHRGLGRNAGRHGSRAQCRPGSTRRRPDHGSERLTGPMTYRNRENDPDKELIEQLVPIVSEAVRESGVLIAADRATQDYAERVIRAEVEAYCDGEGAYGDTLRAVALGTEVGGFRDCHSGRHVHQEDRRLHDDEAKGPLSEYGPFGAAPGPSRAPAPRKARGRRSRRPRAGARWASLDCRSP